MDGQNTTQIVELVINNWGVISAVAGPIALAAANWIVKKTSWGGDDDLLRIIIKAFKNKKGTPANG